MGEEAFDKKSNLVELQNPLITIGERKVISLSGAVIARCVF